MVPLPNSSSAFPKRLKAPSRVPGAALAMLSVARSEVPEDEPPSIEI
jgi:hypothetical protein